MELRTRSHRTARFCILKHGERDGADSGSSLPQLEPWRAWPSAVPPWMSRHPLGMQKHPDKVVRGVGCLRRAGMPCEFDRLDYVPTTGKIDATIAVPSRLATVKPSPASMRMAWPVAIAQALPSMVRSQEVVAA
jgi:hypothetical protein